MAKILFFDIETSSNIAHVWGKYDQTVIKFVKEWELLSIAWKWNSGKVESMTRADSRRRDDKDLAVKLHSLILEADIVIAHNLKRFDLRKAKSRFLFHGLSPIRKIGTIDTLQVARSNFAFNSNSLNDLAIHLGICGKLKHQGFDMWEKSMLGDKKALAKMGKYNRRDVSILYKVYKKMRGWIDNHPSIVAISNTNGCPVCGSKKFYSHGIRGPQGKPKQSRQCRNCGRYYLAAVPKDF